MKKIILLILLTLTITGCGPKKEEFVPGTLDGETDIKEISDIFTLTIDEESITSESLESTITNNSDITYYLYGDYRIEKKQDDKWYKLKMERPMGVMANLQPVDPGEAQPFHAKWRTWYGELPSGKYRIIIDFYEYEKSDIRYYTAAEFSIKEA